MRPRWLLLVVFAACVGGRARPIPPHTFPAALDDAFFEAGRDDKPKMRVHLIDVGQGAATLVEFSCAAILIDTGGEENRKFDSTQALMTYLHAFFQTRPDLDNTLALLVLTHPHIDHTRGAPVVLGELTVKNLVTDGLTTSSGGRQQRMAIGAARSKKMGAQAVTAGDIPAGGLTSPVIDPVSCPDGDPDIRVMWGAYDKWDQNMNNHSVAVRISLGKSSILITGDLEEDGIAGMLKKHRGTNALDVDVYEVGHHGSYNATTSALLRAMTPQLALIACGPYDRRTSWTGWAYGHPRAVTIGRLEDGLHGMHRSPVVVPVATAVKSFEGWQITAPIYATGWDSDVIVSMYADGHMAVKTRREH